MGALTISPFQLPLHADFDEEVLSRLADSPQEAIQALNWLKDHFHQTCISSRLLFAKHYLEYRQELAKWGENSLVFTLKKVQLFAFQFFEKVFCILYRQVNSSALDRSLQKETPVSFEETKRLLNSDQALSNLCTYYNKRAIDLVALAGILAVKNQDGSTPMHYNNHLHSKLGFLIEQLDKIALGELLLIQNRFGATPLHNCESLQELLVSLIEKLDIEELFALLKAQNNFGHTLLHHCVDASSLYPILEEKLGKEVLLQLLEIKDSDGRTPDKPFERS